MNMQIPIVFKKALPAALVALVLHSPVAFGAKDAPEVLGDFIDSVRTFAATFEQILQDENGEVVETWSGQFWMRRPGRFRWRYERPYVQEIIGDGERIYHYDEELKQLIIDFQKEVLAAAPARFLFDRPALNQFDISDIGWLGDLRLIQLADKRRDTAYEEFLIAFRDGVIAAVEMRDSFDQVTRISYSNVRINGKLSADTLRLPSMPADVDVLDRTREPTAPAPRPAPSTATDAEEPE